MKRPILILSAGVVVIALLLLVNEKWIKETSAPKSAAKQQESKSVQQDLPTEQKTTDKPTSKPPVYDLSQKAHWYDPETTIGFRGSYQTLAKWLEPFQPTPEEFQIIAQYENERKKLKESISEDEYYSVEGRLWLIDETLKLNNQLREDMGEERTLFYFEVRELGTGYYDTWKVLTVNGISEERVAEFRELADEFNQQMHGIPLFRAERPYARYLPDDWDIDVDEQRRIAKTFRERIEKEFGRQVLEDILSLRGGLFFMDQLDKGDPRIFASLMQDLKTQTRMEKLYDVDFSDVDDAEAEEAYEKHKAERERLEKREMEFMEEWIKHHEQQQAEPEEASGGSP